MVFGKIKDIIKKRREESEQREATSTGFKTVTDYNKWKQETRIKAREKLVHTSQKKKKQKLKEKIEKSESNRNKPILEIYVDAFDKIGKGVDKFQKGVDKFEKGIGQLEDGLIQVQRELEESQNADQMEPEQFTEVHQKEGQDQKQNHMMMALVGWKEMPTPKNHHAKRKVMMVGDG